MTRFARSKGSKSSNERAPEDSTPWEVMKEQLMQSKKEKEEAGKRQEAENQRITNYENFLKDQKVSKRKATWCDFPEEQAKKRLLPLKQPPNNKQQDTPNKPDVSKSAEDPTTQEKSIKKKKNKKTTESLSTALTETTHADTPPETEASVTGKKQKNKNKNKKTTESSPTTPAGTMQTETPAETGASVMGKKKKKKNKKNQNANNRIENIAQTEESNAVDIPFTNKNNPKPNKQTENNLQKKKKGKMVNGAPARRKEINDQSFQLIINTKEVELVRFDGFPIMKKDAERLTELRKNMIQKGIPKSEVQRTMKLERRRAEKALARLKREVCYNCRKGGHNLSDCPELKSKIPGVDAADGICFKCGSTEHRQFECKVQRDNEFRFATCFICREQGHLARQCPDNPKGLYPNGGSCKLCGDVTHLRKDCPTTQGQREETSLKLGTLESIDNIEDIGQQVKVTTSTEADKKKVKKINF